MGSAGYWGLVWFFASFPAFHFTDTLLIVGTAMLALGALLGELHTTMGRWGLLSGLIALAALLIGRRRSRAIWPGLEHALSGALGSDYRVGTTVQDRESHNPLEVRQAGVERIADLPYGDAGVRNLLDLYRPVAAAGQSGLPILLWVHGGAWITGHKTQQGLPLMYSMAKRGWLVAGINYRLGPKSRFPEPLIDVKRAIAWLREHAAQFGGDPHFIIAAGGSAGGHLAALAALTPNRPDYQPGFEALDTALAGAIPLYSRFDFIDRSNVLRRKQFLIKFLADKVMPCAFEHDPQIWDQASPIAQVNSDAPPMFVLHGTHDSLIPMAEANAFVVALRRVSRQPVVFAQLYGAQHAWDLLNTPWTRSTVNAVERFALHLHAQYRQRQGI